MNATMERSAGNTITFLISIAWVDVSKTYTEIVNNLIAQVELPGFRKGKAPRELAEKQIDKTKVYEEVIRKLVPRAYTEAVSQHTVRPIVNPKVELLEAAEGKDWKIKVQTAEKPQVKLGDYRQAVSKLYAEKQTKIWVPGEEKADDKKEKGPTVGQVLEALYAGISVDLSPIILEQEVNRMLSNLVGDIQKLGLTVEQYLQAQGKTNELLRQDYETQAKKTLGLEFALEEIAEKEQVTVDEKEVEDVVKNAKTEAERKQLSEQKYYIASLIRRQKTINALMTRPKLDPLAP